MAVEYIRISETLIDFGKLVPKSELWDHIHTNHVDFYRSIYNYSEEDYNHFKLVGSVRGLRNLTTRMIVFDFDSGDNVELARADTIEMLSRLATLGINLNDINICFSGSKGFSIEFETTTTFTPDELKNLATRLAVNLNTFDPKVYNPSRIFRIPFTKHNVTGNYKIPISSEELSNTSVADIAELSGQFNTEAWGKYKEDQVILPEALKAFIVAPAPKKKEVILDLDTKLDLNLKPKDMPACKFAILNGHFNAGNRNNALMSLAAFFKTKGFPDKVTYGVLRQASKLQSERTGQEEFDKEEIWHKIIKVVYHPTWKGPGYSCKDNAFLKEICPVQGSLLCKDHKEEVSLPKISDFHSRFREFAIGLDQNRISLGIPEVDDKTIITTSMSVGLLGAPSSGKTSISLNIINNASRAGIPSLFCSFDMGWPLVYAKLISRHSKLDFEQVLEVFKKEPNAYAKYHELLLEEYGNVRFDFKSSQTVEAIKESVLNEQSRSGEKIRLLVIDYLECMTGPFSDPTANSGHIANQLKDLANELDLCIITLVQPQKAAGDPSKPLVSMRQIKGASILEQSFSIILGVYREGFSAQYPDNDKYMTIAVLKNRMGGLSSTDLAWNGREGSIRALSAGEAEDLSMLREDLKKKESSGGTGFGI